eukprot:22864-Rhodomonas_salina.1
MICRILSEPPHHHDHDDHDVWYRAVQNRRHLPPGPRCILCRLARPGAVNELRVKSSRSIPSHALTAAASLPAPSSSILQSDTSSRASAWQAGTTSARYAAPMSVKRLALKSRRASILLIPLLSTLARSSTPLSPNVMLLRQTFVSAVHSLNALTRAHTPLPGERFSPTTPMSLFLLTSNASNGLPTSVSRSSSASPSSSAPFSPMRLLLTSIRAQAEMSERRAVSERGCQELSPCAVDLVVAQPEVNQPRAPPQRVCKPLDSQHGDAVAAQVQMSQRLTFHEDGRESPC